MYHAYREDKHLDFHQLHEKYGPIVRYGPNTLSINHPAALKAIYGHKANVRKSDFYLSFPAAPGVFSTHTAIDRTAHARKRRVMSHAFSETALKSVEEYVLGHVQTYIQKLAGATSSTSRSTDGWTEPRDVQSWSSYFGFDVMSDLAFSKAFGMLEGDDPSVRRANFLLGQAAKRHNVTGPMPWLHQSGFDRLLFRGLNKNRDAYMKFSKSLVGQRMNSDIYNSSRRDFFYYLLNAKDPETGQGFAKGELWGESNTLIIAGSDTTSTTITSTLFYLLHNPAALARVQQELRDAFPSSAEDIRYGPVLNGCTYLRACIDEAMRMSPPVGGLLPRVTLPGGLDIPDMDDLHIPAGVGVGCPIYTMHHNEDYVADPFTYRPERWLASETVSAESVEALHSVFNPFSVGPRGCIGKPMAYLEMSLALGRLLWGYEIRLASGELGTVGEGNGKLGRGRERRGEFQMWDIFVADKEGPWAEFRPRSQGDVHN